MRALALAFDDAQSSRSKIHKVAALSAAFRAAAEGAPPEQRGRVVATAARLATGRALPVADPRSVGVGWAMAHAAVASAFGVTPEALAKQAREAGDLGEAVGKITRADGDHPGVDLAAVAALFDALAATGKRSEKQTLLEGALRSASTIEAKYLVKVLLGELRIGVQEGLVIEAIAKAFEAPVADVRRAAALMTDVGDVAVLADQRALSKAELVIGRPLAFMLASPIETLAAPPDPSLLVVEDKLDGIRAQLHRSDEIDRIFGRGLEDVTVAFPEIVAAMKAIAGRVIFDGELLVFGPDGRPRPFQALQPRLRKTPPPPALLASAPVTFVAYDLLFDGESLLDLPFHERRQRLENRLASAVGPIRVLASERLPLGDTLSVAVDRAFAWARARAHEGLLLKRFDAVYEAGSRGASWIKVKKAVATIDAVVVRAERGHGKRAGVLSDYTFSIWDGDRLVTIGKAYSGLTDAEIKTLTARFEALTTAENGSVREVKPEVVLEIAFDGIQPSTRHESGFALRFPRIARIRDDKKPEEADRIETVRALFASQVATGHREDV